MMHGCCSSSVYCYITSSVHHHRELAVVVCFTIIAHQTNATAGDSVADPAGGRSGIQQYTARSFMASPCTQCARSAQASHPKAAIVRGCMWMYV